jgi:CubicO group peptidase (beta-lactamase class C family)
MLHLSKRKKIIVSSLIILSVGLGYGFNFGLEYANIAASYAAKTVCSCVFVSGRTFESVKSEDLYAVPMAEVQVDETKQEVTATVYHLAEAKAIYRKGLGCTLVNEISEAEIRKQANLEITNTLPVQDFILDSIPQNVDIKALQKAIDNAFEEKEKNRIIRTRAVVVLYRGHLIAEKYAPAISPQTPLLGWSMTKSVTNAMVGLLVKAGKIDIYQPAPIDEWKNDERKTITTDQLLRMSSGLSFEENYAKPSDATQMLFRKKGAGAYALTSKLGNEPDQVWYYSSGTSNILQEIIRRQFPNHTDYLAFPYLSLFQKIGMKSAVMEVDASGTFVGSSFMYATARDWAKFGQLFLQDGVWQGERILPEGWVKYSGTPTPKSNGRYAAQFWLEARDADFPQDAFMALGFEGQSVTIIPSKELVIVRLGCTPNENDFDRNQFVKDIVKAIK